MKLWFFFQSISNHFFYWIKLSSKLQNRTSFNQLNDDLKESKLHFIDKLTECEETCIKPFNFITRPWKLHKRTNNKNWNWQNEYWSKHKGNQKENCFGFCISRCISTGGFEANDAAHGADDFTYRLASFQKYLNDCSCLSRGSTSVIMNR